MASITSSELVESVPHGGTKRNIYRYTLSTGEVHQRRSWISAATDNAADMAFRGVMLLDELALAEFEGIIND